MKKLEFKIRIKAHVERVYSSMIEDKSFREWASTFADNTSFEGNWETGSKMTFCAPFEGGKINGLTCIVRENIPNQCICLDYYSVIEDKVEITEGEKVKDFDQYYENYYFEEVGDETELIIRIGFDDQYESYYLEKWPIALEKLRTIIEKTS